MKGTKVMGRVLEESGDMLKRTDGSEDDNKGFDMYLRDFFWFAQALWPLSVECLALSVENISYLRSIFWGRGEWYFRFCT